MRRCFTFFISASISVSFFRSSWIRILCIFQTTIYGAVSLSSSRISMSAPILRNNFITTLYSFYAVWCRAIFFFYLLRRYRGSFSAVISSYSRVYFKRLRVMMFYDINLLNWYRPPFPEIVASVSRILDILITIAAFDRVCFYNLRRRRFVLTIIVSSWSDIF
jgi:hypothetical protein